VVTIVRASSSPDAKKAVVVGAGPAGSLAALYLANLGWHVKVYERRTEAGSDGIRDKGKATTRPDISYNVVLSPRGMNALDGAGVVLPEERIVRLMGNVRHLPGAAPSMSRQFRGTVAVNRDVLADAIVRTATDKHPGRIEFTRGVGVTDVDFASRIAVFGPSEGKFHPSEESTTSSTVSEPYDLLVAADGVNSAVRSMLAMAGDLTVTQNADEMMFKSVKLPPQKSSGSSTGESSNGKMTMAERTAYKERTKCFHTWPRGLVSMLAPPDPAGTLSAVVILPGGAHAGASVNKGGEDGGKSKRWTWDAVNDEESIRSLFADKFPDAFNGDPVPTEACAQITAQSPRPGGITTICSRLTAKDGSVALIGDAAHSVWPSLGQGANCALETAQYLAAAIESKPQDVPSALEYFDAVRTPQVHACGRLSEAGFGGTAKRAGNFLFFAKIGALALLHKTMPFFFDKPALANINDPAWAYDDVEDAVGQETQALAAFGGVSLAAVFGVSVFGWNAFVGFVFGAVKAVALGEGHAGGRGRRARGAGGGGGDDGAVQVAGEEAEGAKKREHVTSGFRVSGENKNFVGGLGGGVRLFSYSFNR
jgi:kynurenine 3-monooxygenase